MKERHSPAGPDVIRENANNRAPANRAEAGVNEELLRITAACNQECVFCNTHGMAFQMSIRDVFQQCYGLDRQSVTPILTGGEPTIHAGFIPMLHLLGEMGFQSYGVQTNAMLFDDARFASDAAAAGLGFAIVSLHAAGPALSDIITGSPGGFARSWIGMHNLAERGVNIIINHALCAANLTGAAGFADFIGAGLYSLLRDRGMPRSLSLSIAQPDGKARGARDIAPRLTDAAPFYIAALRRCDELGIYAVNPGCGIPVCFTPGLEGRSSELRLIESGAGQPRTAWANAGLKTKGPNCPQCLMGSRCLGVWKSYAEMYGLDELKPVTEQTRKAREKQT